MDIAALISAKDKRNKDGPVTHGQEFKTNGRDKSLSPDYPLKLSS
jgi:hypothetical protein